MLKKILITVGVVIAAFLAYAATRPDSYAVERAAVIEAPAAIVFDQLDDFRSWGQWSPWDKLDPGMTKTYEGPESGVGAGYSWQGNSEVGKGRMTIVESSPPREIEYKLEFIEPFSAVAETEFEVEPKGENASSVRWRMEGKNDFMAKVFGVFMDMDAAIGADFEKGLASLKTIAETQAKQAAAQAAQAAAQAQAAAAQPEPSAAPAGAAEDGDQP
jgi:hypothetical protein